MNKHTIERTNKQNKNEQTNKLTGNQELFAWRHIKEIKKQTKTIQVKMQETLVV